MFEGSGPTFLGIDRTVATPTSYVNVADTTKKAGQKMAGFSLCS